VAPPAPVFGCGQREHRQDIRLACVQVWSGFSHLPSVNQCSYPSLASLLNSHSLLNVCIFCELNCLHYVFLMLSVKSLCSIVLFCSPFQLSWLTSFCLFFMYQAQLYCCFLLNLFVICLYLCMFNLIWGCYTMCLVEHTHNGSTPSWSV